MVKTALPRPYLRRLALHGSLSNFIRDLAEDKMEQNEDLAKLRAGVSLAKTGVKQAAVITEDN